MNFTCVRVCGVEGRGKSLSGQFFVCEKDDREESSARSLMTRPKDEMGSQIVSSESGISHPILIYLSQNNNSQAQVDAFQLWQLRSLNFQSFSDPSEICWRVRGASPDRLAELSTGVSPLQKRIESGTFTIVLHATSSFTYVSIIYGANFPFNKFWLYTCTCIDILQAEAEKLSLRPRVV